MITVSLFEDKVSSEQELARLVRAENRRESGLIDRYTEHASTPIAEHIADWSASILNSGSTKAHADKMAGYVQRICDGCKFRTIPEISASAVQQFLADLRNTSKPTHAIDPSKESYTKAELAAILHVKPSAIASLVKRHRLTSEAKGDGKKRRYTRVVAEVLHERRSKGMGIRTSNAHLQAMKQFCRWLVRDRRAAGNPVEHLKGGNVKLDRRRDRRILDESELRRVIAAAENSQVTFRGMTGTDRSVLYVVACATGFRARELSALRPRDFHLDDAAPEVVISGAFTKNKKPVCQPLPVDLVQPLRDYLGSKGPDAAIWPGTWRERAADMFRIHLDACGIPYEVQGPDGPLYADFHQLRHSFVALLDKTGATLKEAMQLARRSDPKLTMAVYGRARLQDLAGAMDRMPTLLPSTPPVEEEAALRATGTDGVPANFLVNSCAPHDGSGGLLRTHEDGAVDLPIGEGVT